MPRRERLSLPAGDFELLAEDAADARVDARVAGSPDGTLRPKPPLVLCLHGFPDHPPSLAPLLSAIADAGYRAVAPWLRGYAPSTLEGPYDVAHVAADIRAIADALSPSGPVYLVGHDWGAVIAYFLAALAPERIAAVVAMSVPHPIAFLEDLTRRKDQRRRSWYMLFFQLPKIAELAVRSGDFALIERLWRDWSPGYALPPAAMTELKDCLARSMPAPIAYYRAALRPSPKAIRQLWAMTQTQIHVPLLYLAGAQDGCIAADIGEGDARFFAGLYRREVVPGVGHFMVNEAPYAVSHRVVDWLGQFRSWRAAAGADEQREMP